jgi:hypothetical protein
MSSSQGCIYNGDFHTAPIKLGVKSAVKGRGKLEVLNGMLE